MAAKKKLVEIDSAPGLGDLDFLRQNQGVSDLSWLSVDVDDYKAQEALPKQNLDIIPEVQRALMHAPDSNVPEMIPLRPHTIVNRNPLEDPYVENRSNNVKIRDRVSSYIIQGLSDADIVHRVSSEFSPQQINADRREIEEVYKERGLLGNVYIDSNHFPRCAQKGPHRKFVAQHAKRALYVLAKSDCVQCVHNTGGHCLQFHPGRGHRRRPHGPSP